MLQDAGSANQMELMGRISSVYGLNEFTWMSNSRRDKMLNDMNELESEL